MTPTSHRLGDDGLIPSKRIRQPLRLAFASFAVAMLIVLGVLGYFLWRTEARSHQIATLACQLVKYTPPGTEPGDDIRAAYGCGSYQVPTSSKATDVPVDQVPDRKTPAATRTVTRNPAAAQPSSPVADEQVVAGTSTAPSRPGATQGRGTVTKKTPTKRPSPTPTPSRSTTDLTCTLTGLVGLPVCPKGT